MWKLHVATTPHPPLSAVIEENFTDGEIGVPANAVELVSVSVNKVRWCVHESRARTSMPIQMSAGI